MVRNLILGGVFVVGLEGSAVLTLMLSSSRPHNPGLDASCVCLSGWGVLAGNDVANCRLVTEERS